MKTIVLRLVSARKITNFSLQRVGIALLFWGFLPISGFSQDLPPRKIRLPDVLREVSGLYIESPDRFWWHNDSGNPAVLYQTDPEGSILDTVTHPDWSNRDWEDITSDDQGRIYIGDFGNNCNCRTDLKIYIYDPAANTVDSIYFSLEDQTLFPPPEEERRFDLEAMFWWNGELHLFSKDYQWGGDYRTVHYVLSDQPGEQTARVQGSLHLKKRVVTGAAISPDGSKVALITYNFKMFLGFIPTSKANVFVFSNFEGTDFLSGDKEKYGIPPYLVATQFESIDFYNEEIVYVASEQTVFIRPKGKRIRVD